MAPPPQDLGLPWVISNLAAAELGWVVFNLPDPATTPASRTKRLVQIAAFGERHDAAHPTGSDAETKRQNGGGNHRREMAVVVLAEGERLSALRNQMAGATPSLTRIVDVNGMLKDCGVVKPSTPPHSNPKGNEKATVHQHRHNCNLTLCAECNQLPHPFLTGASAHPAAGTAGAAGRMGGTCVEGQPHPRTQSTAAGGGGAAAVAGAEAAPGATVQRCSHLFFTSGTSGDPKPVATLNTGLCAYATAAADRYSIGPGDKVMLATVPTFDPSVGDLAMALAAGATICVASWHEVAVDLGRCLQRFEATHVCTTPAIWTTVGRTPLDLPLLRTVVLGGDFMSAAIVSSAHVERHCQLARCLIRFRVCFWVIRTYHITLKADI